MDAHKIDWIAAGKAIESARKRLAMKQKEVAEKAGISPSTYSLLESGRRGAGSAVLAKICSILHLDLSELVGLQPNPTPAQGKAIDALCRTVIDLQEAVQHGGVGIVDSLTEFLNKFGPQIIAAGGGADEGSALPLLSLVDGLTPSGHRHRLFENLAAGVAGQVEPLDRICYVAELADRQNISLLVVRGDSMLPTLKPGDVAVVRHVEPPFLLPAMGKDGKKRLLAGLRSVVGDGQLAVFTMNDEGEAVKRFHFRGRDDDWQMVLGADNADWAKDNRYPKPVARTDRLVVYGQVLGVAK